jgi:hypothetical protein
MATGWPVDVNGVKLYPEFVVLVKDRDLVIEAVYMKRAVTLVTRLIPCTGLDNYNNLQNALAEGMDFFYAWMPDGHPKFVLNNPKRLATAEKIAVVIEAKAASSGVRLDGQYRVDFVN